MKLLKAIDAMGLFRMLAILYSRALGESLGQVESSIAGNSYASHAYEIKI